MMHTPNQLAARAAIAKAAALAALLFAQPAFAQDDGASDDSIEIPADLQPQGARRANGGTPRLPPPSGQPTFVPTQPATRVAGPPSVLAILAHPDDEITMAPILARIAREGGGVTIVFATSGDAGPGVSDMAPGKDLAELRENEARCAAFALGVPEPTFWQYGDGTLASIARGDLTENNDADNDAGTITARITAIIAETGPHAVMTWGPDGGYGHADHRMISNAVTQAVQSMGDGRPDLLYAAFPKSDDEGLPGFEGWATIHPSLITDRIRYQPADLEATRGAVACYQSQFPDAARAALPDILHSQLWQGTVYFRLAFQRQ